MKKIFYTIAIGSSLLLTSCYSTIHTYGEGPQKGQSVTGKNTYLFWGGSPLKMTKPEEMAGGAKDFNVITRFTVIDQIISALTLGIYGQSTTTVQK